MQLINKFSITLFISLLFNSCGLFETRTPTSPDSDGGNFIPPTSVDIVIDNLVTAFNIKKVDNYCNCFLDSLYEFKPSVDANLNYPGMFDIWKVDNERKYFLNLVNTLGQSNNIKLQLLNIKYESQSSDSVVLFADYSIDVELSDNLNTKYIGIMSLTMFLTNNGFWSISRWLDFQKENETEKTFSELKAKFYN